MPVTLFNSASTRGGWINREEIAAFLTGCEIFLRRNRPDLVWTYGGDPVSSGLHQLVKQLGIPILFALHNFAYSDPALFAPIDCAIVPTEFARRFYRDTIGLQCRRLPLVMDGARVRVPERQPQYVTFVNPEPRKGVYVVARIADVLARRRPDIPVLVVEGAARTSYRWLLGIDLGGLKNIKTMPNTPDPRQFYAVTKLLLMPSLMENAGFVAMEAMLNGIPVLASNRAGLPETIGDAGFSFDIPAAIRGRPVTCPRPRRSSPGSRRSSVYGTTRPSTSAGAVRAASAPSNGIPTGWRAFTASFSAALRTSPAHRWCRGK